jgi:tetratricopeptide (TPR) repeat protein
MRGLAVALLCACSAPATLPELVAANRSESAGDIEAALASYRAAQQRCSLLQPPRRAKQACSEALLGEAELLDHAQRTDAALAAYLAIPARVTDDDTTAATAIYRAGQLDMHAARTKEAWTLLWKVVTAYPDEPLAADALKTLLDDGRSRAPKELAAQLGSLLNALAETRIADNLVWSLADLYAHELGDPATARGYYDRIPIDFPQSGLRDDARWYAAKLSEDLGDPRGAVTRLRGLLATREVAFGVGSYFSVWLDDAQLELGKVLRDSLGDLPGAAAAFRQLPKDYPASILRDDALYELGVTLGKAGDQAGRCRAIAAMVKLEPDSKYVARAQELGPCR